MDPTWKNMQGFKVDKTACQKKKVEKTGINLNTLRTYILCTSHC